MNNRVTLAVLLSFCTLLPALGQTPAVDDKDDVVRITTNLVQIDVAVTKDGKPVPNLKAEDFELYEDGHRQTITSFAFVSNVANTATPLKSSETKNGAFVPPAPIKRDVPRRTIAIVVDDLGLSNGSPNMTMQTKLFRDGKSVKSSPETAVDTTNQNDPNRLVITNVLRLPGDLEPGDYYLQVVVTDKAAGAKQPPATQWVNFEIVK